MAATKPKNDLVKQGEEVVKKKHRNRPDLANFGQENVKPGDNTRYIRHALATYHLPPIDISDPKQVEERINWYFNHCMEDDMKPTVMGFCNALGIDRSTLAGWRRGDHRAESHSPLIKKAYDFLQEQWEDYMTNGKINPVSGIFLGKNNFDYQDKQEYVITPNNPLGDTTDPANVRKRLSEGTSED